MRESEYEQRKCCGNPERRTVALAQDEAALTQSSILPWLTDYAAAASRRRTPEALATAAQPERMSAVPANQLPTDGAPSKSATENPNTVVRNTPMTMAPRLVIECRCSY